MKIVTVKIKKIIDTCSGPFDKNITTYLLFDKYNKRYMMHLDPNKNLLYKINNILGGIVINVGNSINYHLSKHILNNKQYELFQ